MCSLLEAALAEVTTAGSRFVHTSVNAIAEIDLVKTRSAHFATRSTNLCRPYGQQASSLA